MALKIVGSCFLQGYIFPHIDKVQYAGTIACYGADAAVEYIVLRLVDEGEHQHNSQNFKCHSAKGNVGIPFQCAVQPGNTHGIQHNGNADYCENLFLLGKLRYHSQRQKICHIHNGCGDAVDNQ